jgi:hypothetical protein
LLALGLGETVEHVRSLRGRLRTTAVLALLGLTVASATVVVASVWVPYDYTWTVTNDIPGWQQMPVGQLNRMKEQRALRQFDDPYWSPIALNLRTIAHPRRLPLRWFRGGPSTQGIVLLTLAIAGVASALAVAVHRESEQTRGEGLEADTDPSRKGVHNVEPARASPS